MSILDLLKEKMSRIKHKEKLQSLYKRGADYIEISLNFMHAAMTALCDGERECFYDYIDKTIQAEKESDVIHDDIIQRLFGKETLVFSREDRLYLVNEIDDIVDSAESVVRRAAIYFPKQVPAPLITSLISMTDKIQVIGTLVKDAVKDIFDDFDRSLQSIKKVEDIRRDARTDYQRFLEKLFALVDLPARDLLYYDRLIRRVSISIGKANKFCDGLRRLIFKYRL